MSRPIIPLLIAIIAGIYCSNIFLIPDSPIQICLGFQLFLIPLILINNKYRLLYPVVLFCFFLIGILVMNADLNPHRGKDHIINYVGKEKINIEGMICDNPQVSPERTELVVSAFRIFKNGQYLPVSGRLLLNVREPCFFHYGDVIRFASRLRLPHNFGNPGGFDYEKYLRLRGIVVRGFVNDAEGIVVLRSEMGNPLRTRLERFRDIIRKSIMETSPDTEGTIIQAMILGDQKRIPRETMDKFNRTGTTHIIAISGFNIGIVAVFSLFLVRLFLKSSEYLLLRWNLKFISTVSAIFVVILYTFIAGSGISVVRASIMVVLFMIAILINRERDLYNTLALAAFFILIINPASLYDISFQLSFVAVLSLLFLVPRLTALIPPLVSSDSSCPISIDWYLYHLKKALRHVILFFFVSLSATLGTLPLIIFYFNRLSVVTLAANFLVVPILGIVALPLCLFIVLTAPISSVLTDFIIRIAALLVQISLFIIDQLATLSWSSIYVTTPTFVEIGAFYILLISIGFFFDGVNNKKASQPPSKMTLIWKIIPIVLILYFVINGILNYFQELHQDKLTFTAVDVGQGSATLIQFPGGKRMLVDGGGFFDDTFDVGKHVLAPFLWHEKINRIDTLVLTHPHPDHLQGLLFILENFQVRQVWTNGDKVETPVYLAFQQIIQDRGVALKTLSEKTPEMNFSGVKIKVLNPQEDPIDRYAAAPSYLPADNPAPDVKRLTSPVSQNKKRFRVSDELNNRSLVLRISYGIRTFLLTGDISEASERHLVKSPFNLRSDVIFVPHHGGFHSSTDPFLEKVRPQIAIISCGFDNVFRVPHADVLRRYERLQSRVYRTDRDGAVTIITNGSDIHAQTFRSVVPE